MRAALEINGIVYEVISADSVTAPCGICEIEVGLCWGLEDQKGFNCFELKKALRRKHLYLRRVT